MLASRAARAGFNESLPRLIEFGNHRTARVDFYYNVRMTTQVNDIAGIVRILHERPDWLETIKGIIVGEELMSLPREVAKFVEATNENFRLVHERLDRLEAGQAELKAGQAELKAEQAELKAEQAETNRRLGGLERRFNRMEGRFSNFEGGDYERKVRQRVLMDTVFELGLNNPVIVMSQDGQSTPAWYGAVHRAFRAGLVSREQVRDLGETDLIIADDDGAHVLVEASITASNSDIERAVRRAGVLALALDTKVVPAVVTSVLAEPQRAFAEQQGVSVFIAPYRGANLQPDEDAA